MRHVLCTLFLALGFPGPGAYLHAQSPATPSPQTPAQAAVMVPQKQAPVAASTPLVIHLVGQPAAAQAPVQQVAYMVAQPTAQQAVVAAPAVTATTGTLRHPGPIRRMLGGLGAELEKLRHDHIRLDPVAAAPAPVSVQLVAQPATTAAAVYAAPAPPAVPSAQH